jgi:hypothetical protein
MYLPKQDREPHVPDFVHHRIFCARCKEEQPYNQMPVEYERLVIGWNESRTGLQIRCARHHTNVLYLTWPVPEEPMPITINGVVASPRLPFPPALTLPVTTKLIAAPRPTVRPSLEEKQAFRATLRLYERHLYDRLLDQTPSEAMRVRLRVTVEHPVVAMLIPLSVPARFVNPILRGFYENIDVPRYATMTVEGFLSQIANTDNEIIRFLRVGRPGLNKILTEARKQGV